METLPKRSWYTKKRYTIPLAILGIFALALANSTPAPTAVSTPMVAATAASAPAAQSAQVQATDEQLSNNNYYTNVSGNEVHSPAYAPAIPANATAQCGDGTYSFSQHRSGTCSHHGGVATWY